jgi:hypothetical protein
MEIILWILFGYLVQAVICAIINILVATRIPRSGIDFLRLTFLPWLLLHLDEVKLKKL